MLRRNSVQALFNGYYFDYQMAALKPTSDLMLNEMEIAYAQKGGKPPTPSPMI